MSLTAAHDPASKPPEGYIPLPGTWKRVIKDAAVGLTMATWVFIRSWSHFLADSRRFFSDLPVLPFELWALFFNIVALAAVIVVGISLWRRFSATLVGLGLEMGLVALLVFPADYVRSQIIGQTDAELVAFLRQIPVVLVGITLVMLVFWQHRWVARAVAILMFVTSPVAVVTLIKIVLTATRVLAMNACPVSEPCLPLLPVTNAPVRVVWIIFDETDYRMAFGQRPAGVKLPEFDALLDCSVSSRQAYAPADFTIVSMPSLICGRRLDGVSLDQCDISLHLSEPATNQDFSAMPTVFSAAHEMGINTGLVGWFIPYARLLGPTLNYCSWYAMPAYRSVGATNFADAIHRQVAALAWPMENRQLYIEICRNSLRDAVSVAADPKYGLLLFHLPPPHFPGIYLPDQKEFTALGIKRPAAYFNNLALADRELGEIRRKMESAGQWDKTWVIMSADHSWRSSRTFDGVRDYRVPFLVKPPGSKQAATYDKQFNTILTHDLILAILHGQITNATDLPTWLDAHIIPATPVMPSGGGFE